MHLYAALGLGRLRLFTGRCPPDAVGKVVFPHRNSSVSQEIVVDRAASVFLLRAEKELALLSQVQDMGGILQGMSGSPVIQNGRLVGAVTHVLVDKPTCGYGIFAERMYNELSDLPKSLGDAA